MATSRSGELRAICIAPDRAADFWPLAADFIAKAYERGNGDSTADHERGDVLAGRKLLWLAFDGKRITAAAVTELSLLPRGAKIGIVTCCAGIVVPQWNKLLGEIERYFRAEGCEASRVYGRLGWKRVLTGYREPWVVLEKRLT